MFHREEFESREREREREIKKKLPNKNLVYVCDETIDCSHINSLFVIARRLLLCSASSSSSVRAVDADGDCGINVGRYSRKADNESGGKTKKRELIELTMTNSHLFTDFHDEYSTYGNRLKDHELSMSLCRREIRLYDVDEEKDSHDYLCIELISVDIEPYWNLLRM